MVTTTTEWDYGCHSTLRMGAFCMGFLGKLFGVRRGKPKPYLDAGIQLQCKLIQSLRLEGWQNLLPVYTREEDEAISKGMSLFQQIANEEAGGEALFHPDAIGAIRRQVAGQALEGLAERNLMLTDTSELPNDWKERLSTYLKAWLCDLNPSAMRGVANLLSKAGYKAEANKALRVALSAEQDTPARREGLDNLLQKVFSKANRVAELQSHPLEELSSALLTAVIRCRDAVISSGLIQAPSEKERKRAEVFIFWEFVFFFWWIMANCFAPDRLTESHRARVNKWFDDMLVPLSIDLYCDHWPESLKHGMRDDFRKALLNASIEYVKVSEQGTPAEAGPIVVGRLSCSILELCGRQQSDVENATVIGEMALAEAQKMNLPTLLENVRRGMVAADNL